MRSDVRGVGAALGLCVWVAACAAGEQDKPLASMGMPAPFNPVQMQAEPSAGGPAPLAPASPQEAEPQVVGPTMPSEPVGPVTAPQPSEPSGPSQPSAPEGPSQPSQPGPVMPTDGAAFPRTDAPVSVALKGPYQFATEPMTDPDWADAMLYYPTDAPAPHAIMLVSPGFTETKEHMTWWAEMLASHGFVVLNTSPFNTLTDQPPDRGTDLQTALKRITAEQTRAGSPVAGKLALDRIALSGHSMGGGGTVWAASREGGSIRAAIPLMPHTPFITDADMKKITAATLYIAGELDPDLLGSPTKYSIPHFQTMTSTVERAVMVFRGGDHFIGVNGGQFHDVVARYSVAWLKIYLEDDERYRTYVYGADHDPAPFSTFMTAP